MLIESLIGIVHVGNLGWTVHYSVLLLLVDHLNWSGPFLPRRWRNILHSLSGTFIQVFDVYRIAWYFAILVEWRAFASVLPLKIGDQGTLYLFVQVLIIVVVLEPIVILKSLDGCLRSIGRSRALVVDCRDLCHDLLSRLNLIAPEIHLLRGDFNVRRYAAWARTWDGLLVSWNICRILNCLGFIDPCLL